MINECCIPLRSSNFCLSHLKQITLMRPAQQRLNALPTAVCKVLQVIYIFIFFQLSECSSSENLTFLFNITPSPVPVQSAPGAHWLTSSQLAFLKLWTTAARWQKSWTLQNLCPLILSGKRLTFYRETCWCFNFWHLPGEANSASVTLQHSLVHLFWHECLPVCLSSYLLQSRTSTYKAI